MKRQTILNVPYFYKDRVKPRRRRKTVSCTMCSRHLIAIPEIASRTLSTAVTSGGDPIIYEHEGRLLRPLRSRDAITFTLDDLKQTERMSIASLLELLAREPDHPFAPIAPDSLETDPLLYLDDADHDVDPDTLAWFNKIISVDDGVFGPAYLPCLAVSFDAPRRRLIAQAYAPPLSSLALRFPTIHLPIEAGNHLLGEFARAMHIEEIEIDHLGIELHTKIESSQNWSIFTFAALRAYCFLKGASNWPAGVSFSPLEGAHTALRRVEHHSVDGDWIASFMQSSPAEFGNLEPYVVGLQALIRARFQVLGEPILTAGYDIFDDLYL